MPKRCRDAVEMSEQRVSEHAVQREAAIVRLVTILRARVPAGELAWLREYAPLLGDVSVEELGARIAAARGRRHSLPPTGEEP
jgi:hypothetical protein